MEIVEMNTLTVVGLSVKARWRDLWTEMPEAWRRFLPRRDEIENRAGETFVDVSLDKVDDVYHQIVGALVSKADRVPEGMRAVEIPAQRYIHHRHVGPVREIADSFGAIYTWARDHGHPAAELKVDVGYTVAGGEMEHDLYVGLVPARAGRELSGQEP